MDAKRFENWVDRYRSVWESNDPEEIGALFAPDGRYYDSPGDEPWSGRENILWEISLDDQDRCSRFTEWWMLRR